MKELKFGKLKIGGNNPVVVIAEIADSHNGSLDTAKKLITAAKDAGADVVKFQLHLPDTEMVPDSIQMWDGPLYDILKRNLFTPQMHKEIMDYCDKVGIEYLCTPFCPAAVDILYTLGVKAFKTGSGELANLPQQRKIAKISSQTGRPVIVSTGMSTWEEISDTVRVYEEEGAKENLVLMNCTSEYPPNDYSHANLGLIKKLKESFSVWTGQSDHTMDNYTAYAAVALGAKVIEKHFTLSRNQSGPDHFISLEPHMLKELVCGVRKIEVALGEKKSISPQEQVVRDWAFHSVVAAKNIRAGEDLTLENLIPKRPGSGIPAKYLDPMFSHKLLGKKAKRDLSPNTILSWEDIQ
jgi:N-acetylneuraminate synthase